MEAGESGLYLFSACAVATLLWHPASPLQPHLPSDAVRRILMGLAMGTTIIAIVLTTVGQTVRSALQSRGHSNVSSIGESGLVGYRLLLRGATFRCRRRRGGRLVCASRCAGAQGGPLRRHHARHVRGGRRICRRTVHFVSLDERSPVRVQSQTTGALYTLLCRLPGSGIHCLRVSFVRNEHKSCSHVRPRIMWQLLARPLDLFHRATCGHAGGG